MNIWVTRIFKNGELVAECTTNVEAAKITGMSYARVKTLKQSKGKSREGWSFESVEKEVSEELEKAIGEKKICQICGNEFHVLSKYSKAQKYCSKRCLEDSKNQKKRNKNQEKKCLKDMPVSTANTLAAINEEARRNHIYYGRQAAAHDKQFPHWEGKHVFRNGRWEVVHGEKS